MTEIEELKKRIDNLEALTDALLRERWHSRGEMKGQVGKIEKELEPYFQDWLKRSKINESRKVENEV